MSTSRFNRHSSLTESQLQKSDDSSFTSTGWPQPLCPDGARAADVLVLPGP